MNSDSSHLIASEAEHVQAQPPTGPSRAEHLAWCKKRALEYCDSGDTQEAFTSMASDLNKHAETANHIGIQLGFIQMMNGMLSDPRSMRHFIEGFN